MAVSRDHINDSLGVTRAVTDANPEEVPEAGQSIRDMVQRMQNYVLPPTMDFIKNTAVDPFAMYIFEFTHKLNRQDLVDTCQNLRTQIAQTAEKQDVNITHELGSAELIDSSVSLGDIRFMVFKIKKKAEQTACEKAIAIIRPVK